MGQESDVMMDYLDNNERFADVFNGGCFYGQKVVKPEELEEGSEVYKEVRGRKTIPRIRDLKKRLKSGGRLKVLAIENQGDIDYTMPWRHMNYDSLEYGKQIRNIKNQNKNKRKDLPMTGAEYKCGLYSTDRLSPAFTVCLYTGKEKWTGPRSLKDMIEVMGVMVGMKKPVAKQKEEGKGVNMCEALRGMLEDSKNEGETLKLISLVRKKYLKGKSLEVIADEVEESPEMIEPILSLVKQYPEDTNEEIYQRMNT